MPDPGLSWRPNVAGVARSRRAFECQVESKPAPLSAAAVREAVVGGPPPGRARSPAGSCPPRPGARRGDGAAEDLGGHAPGGGGLEVRRGTGFAQLRSSTARAGRPRSRKPIPLRAAGEPRAPVGTASSPDVVAECPVAVLVRHHDVVPAVCIEITEPMRPATFSRSNALKWARVRSPKTEPLDVHLMTCILLPSTS